MQLSSHNVQIDFKTTCADYTLRPACNKVVRIFRCFNFLAKTALAFLSPLRKCISLGSSLFLNVKHAPFLPSTIFLKHLLIGKQIFVCPPFFQLVSDMKHWGRHTGRRENPKPPQAKIPFIFQPSAFVYKHSD